MPFYLRKEVVNLILKGRRKILVPKPDVINKDTLFKAVSQALSVHFINSKECDYLWQYYKGEQEILNRKKVIRPEITNTVVANHAYEIATFKIGYIYGDPISYTQRGKTGIEEGFSDVNVVALLNECMKNDDKPSKDKELGEWQQVCGTSYRMVLPTPVGSEEIFETEILDPRDSFVVYDTGFGKKPWMCGTYTTCYLKGEYVYKLTIYTENTKSTLDYFIGTSRNFNMENITYGFLPIIEYPANVTRIGCFEPVLSLMHTINLMESNRADSIEQFVQYYMKLINVDITDKDFEKFKKQGLIKIKVPQGMKGDFEIVTVELDQIQTQSYVDSLYQKMLQIAGVPDRNASAGGNTGQALIIGQGWSNTEARAKDTELMYIKSDKLFLKAVLQIIKDTLNAPKELKNLKLKEIDIRPSRNKTENLLVKTQALTTMLEAGVHPRIAFQICGIFSDPEQAYVDSQPYLDDKWLRSLKDKTEKKEIKSEQDVIPKLPVTG